MALLCATDDFVVRTLKAVPGIWSKLQYVASLRGPDGRYYHWGLIRVYGEAAAHEAIHDAHCSVLLEVLRTPLRELLGAAEASAAAGGVPLLEFVRALSSNVDGLLPAMLKGGSEKHFSSVLEALAALVLAGRVSSRPTSSRFLRPGR